MRGIDKMQIKTVSIPVVLPLAGLTPAQVPFGLENPRRIAHHAQFKAFLVACTRTTPSRIGDAEDRISSLKVLDDTMFNGEIPIRLQTLRGMLTHPLQRCPLSLASRAKKSQRHWRYQELTNILARLQYVLVPSSSRLPSENLPRAVSSCFLWSLIPVRSPHSRCWLRTMLVGACISWPTSKA